MKGLEYKKKMWTMILVATGAVAIYGLMFYDMYTTERTAADSTASLKETEKRVQAFASLRNLQNDIAKDSEFISASVGSRSDQVAIIEYIESLAHEQDIYISIQSVTEVTDGIGPALALDVITEGSWSQIYAMMKKIEHMKYISSIALFRLEKVDAITAPRPLGGAGDVQAVGAQTQTTKPGWRVSYRLSIPILES